MRFIEMIQSLAKVFLKWKTRRFDFGTMVILETVIPFGCIIMNQETRIKLTLGTHASIQA